MQITQTLEPLIKVSAKPEENVRKIGNDFIIDLNTLLKVTTSNKNLIETLMGLEVKNDEMIGRLLQIPQPYINLARRNFSG